MNYEEQKRKAALAGISEQARVNEVLRIYRLFKEEGLNQDIASRLTIACMSNKRSNT